MAQAGSADNNAGVGLQIVQTRSVLTEPYKVAFQTCRDRLVRLRKLERATGDPLVKVDVAS